MNSKKHSFVNGFRLEAGHGVAVALSAGDILEIENPGKSGGRYLGRHAGGCAGIFFNGPYAFGQQQSVLPTRYDGG